MIKLRTGIEGIDAVTRGGLPAGRTTLVEGGTGSGKTVFALQCLANAAREDGEACVFVCFEEPPERVIDHAEGFGWNLPALAGQSLHFLDARPDVDLVRTGEMDISGLIAALESRVASSGATRIVLDAVDVIMELVGSAAGIRREMLRLERWLQQRGLTAIVTAKSARGPDEASVPPALGFLPFMVDCLLHLEHEVVEGVSQRSVRVCKYRGSAFEENAMPMVFGANGLEVAWFPERSDVDDHARGERITTGLVELDAMLHGGYIRGASILVTGAPGTAKTTLCGAFVDAACRRGESAVFVSFDSRADDIVRNLQSVSIDLAPHIESGQLRLVSLRALSGNTESVLLGIRSVIRDAKASCLVADPLSALAKAGNRGAAPGATERLIDWGRSEGLTVMCTSLLEESSDPEVSTPMQISTIADTWINLTYFVSAGERNRGLSIIKSRGTSHSNQVRELALSA